MRLLTWLGTILRLEAESGRLIHSPLVPVRDAAADFVLTLPPEGLVAPLAGPGDIALIPGEEAGTAYLRRRGQYLGVQAAPYPLFAATQPGPPETLVPWEDEDLDRLRALLTHAWLREDTGDVIRAEDMAVEAGPVLTMPGVRLDLRSHRVPAGAGPDSLAVPRPSGTLHLARVPESRVRGRDIPLRRREGEAMPLVADDAAFGRQTPARLTVAAAAELAIPPILGSLADRDFLYRRARGGAAPACGRVQPQSQVARARDTAVVSGEGAEPIILDGTDVLSEGGLPGGVLPRHVRRDGGQYFIGQALLDGAPRLAGPHALCHGFGEDEAWLTGAMLRLCLLAPYLPEDTTLLLPAMTAPRQAGRRAMLEAFGFGAMRWRDMPGPACRVEELFWAERCAARELPGCVPRAARDRVLARHAPSGRKRTRLYVQSAGPHGVANPFVTENVLTRQGFTPVELDGMAIGDRIDLFRRADMVVAVHGEALDNLLFCRPRTQVLELSPECEYRPVFAELSAKLGLSHAVLPCATDDGTFEGRLTVPAPRLTALLGMLLSRQAA